MRFAMAPTSGIRAWLLCRPPLSELGVIPRIRVMNVGEKLGNAELLWLRMLQCIPGMSAAKATAVAEWFPSLGSLLRAYEGCRDESERIELLEVGNEGNVEA